ncbi:MAG: TylF/MycF/NovP-related O-methyltransferase [Chloroflexota bacterium]
MLTRIRRFAGARRRTQVSSDFRRRRPHLAGVIQNVIGHRLTYLSAGALEDLADVVAEAEMQQIPGSLVEAGTAVGGSAIVLAAAKSPARPLVLYDVFGTIPPPSETDGADVRHRYEVITAGAAAGIGGDTYYGYREDLRGDVERNLASFGIDSERDNVRYVRGLYQDTMPVREPVAIAHLDCDWYESVMTCLTGIAPTLVPGGRFVIDDYDFWSGCRTAVDEFLSRPEGRRFHVERRARVHLVAAD